MGLGLNSILGVTRTDGIGRGKSPQYMTASAEL
jgi:hypothetical protein